MAPEEDEVKNGSSTDERWQGSRRSVRCSCGTPKGVDEGSGTHTKEWAMVLLKLAECCFTNDVKDVTKAFEIGILVLIPKDITSCHSRDCVARERSQARFDHRDFPAFRWHDATSTIAKQKGEHGQQLLN
jgi:hypothetical protein